MAGKRRAMLAQLWEEDECLEYYGLLSLHRMFDIIGSQLTENDIDALSFLLYESYRFTHPLDPSIWTVHEEDAEVMPNNALLSAWQRRSRCNARSENSYDLESPNLLLPKNGTELLLELERRGKCDESNFTHLLQLLRVLTRHDLLPYVSIKRPRTVSPERYTYGPYVLDSDRQVDGCLNPSSPEAREENWETGSNSKKRKRGRSSKRGPCPKPKRSKESSPPPPYETSQNKVTCVNLSSGKNP